MKIAVVSDAILPYNIGGKEKRIFELTNRISKKHSIEIFTMNWWNGKKSRRENNCRLRAVCRKSNLYAGEKRSLMQALAFSFGLFPSLLKSKFDVVDCDEFPFFPVFSSKLACIAKRKPLVVTWHEVWNGYWSEYLGRLGFVGMAVERLASKLPNLIVAVSEKTRRDLIQIGVNPEKIVVVPNGVDVNAIKRIVPANKGFDIVFAGRLLKHKNAHLLIESIDILKKQNPKISCLIVGEGPEFGNLKNMIEEKNLQKNILLRKFFPRQKEILSIMKKSGLFVFPSVREGFGLIVIEANACGLPVLVCRSENNAAVDLVDTGENGCIVRAESRAIAKAIRAMQSQAWDKKLIRAKSAGYDWDSVSKKMEKVYGGFNGSF